MASAILLLGSNLGNKRKNLQEAYLQITKEIGRIEKLSQIYRSPPWGFEHEEDFFNQVLAVKTDLQPEILLTKLMFIEKSLGRDRKGSSSGYQARTIDVDILFYEDIILNTPKLTIPHPRLHLRRFTLEPLNEVYPELKHPLLNKTIRELLGNCTDNSSVEKLNDTF